MIGLLLLGTFALFILQEDPVHSPAVGIQAQSSLLLSPPIHAPFYSKAHAEAAVVKSESPSPGSPEWLAALDKIFWNPDHVGLENRLAPLLDELTMENAQSVAELLDAVNEDLDPAAAWCLFLKRYAELNGAAAWNCALQSKNGKHGLLEALRVWHSQNPTAPELAIAEVASAGDRAYLTRWLAQVKMETSTSSAASWASGLEDPEMRQMAMRDVIRTAARAADADFTAWAGWLAPQATLPESAPAVSELVTEWVKKDGVSAGEWAISLPDGPVRSQALVNLVGQWASLDRRAAGNWLNRHPDKGFLDSAVAVYSELFIHESPQHAFAWAESISDPTLRAATLARLNSSTPRQ